MFVKDLRNVAEFVATLLVAGVIGNRLLHAIALPLSQAVLSTAACVVIGSVLARSASHVGRRSAFASVGASAVFMAILFRGMPTTTGRTANVTEYVAFYNRTRRHGHLGGRSPEQYEAAHAH